MEWFKFFGREFLSDMKVQSLHPLRQHCWTVLLCLASIEEKNGRVPYLNEHALMEKSGLVPSMDDWDIVEGVLEIFKKRGMITYDNEGVTVLNWQKRQGQSLSSYERVKRFREKKRMITDDNVTETQNDNARIEENRIDNTSAVAQKSVFVSEEEDKPRKSAKVSKYPNARTVFGWFDRPQPSWNLNTTELQHAELLYKRGEKNVKGALKFVEEHSEDPFFSRVLKPSDLERKWPNIADYRKRNGL